MVGHDSQHKRETVTTGRCRSLLEIVQWNTNNRWNQLLDAKRSDIKPHQMTLCGSEVPQDRWRGRTAGSGMWTRTRESVLGAPCGDSAIPYG